MQFLMVNIFRRLLFVLLFINAILYYIEQQLKNKTYKVLWGGDLPWSDLLVKKLS